MPPGSRTRRNPINLTRRSLRQQARSLMALNTGQFAETDQLHKQADQIKTRMKKLVLTVRRDAEFGAEAALNYLFEVMDNRPPRIPWRTGALRDSFFVNKVVEGGGAQVSFQFGFSAPYAFIVHEMVGENINWTRPGSGPKFMQTHVRNEQARMMKIIERSVSFR